jgi:peptidoglycan/xylan/chitin deacetylase (PgdA/CDA1 family)
MGVRVLFLLATLLPLTGAEPGFAVLTYHRFGSPAASTTITPEVFEWQLRRLRETGVPVLRLADVVEQARKSGAHPNGVAITVDDGHVSVYTVMFPLIQRYGVPVTLFIYPSAISRASYALSWDQLTQMKMSGLVDIQSHTFWHPNFLKERARRTRRDFERFVETQLAASKKLLEKKLGGKVTMLAWPYGIFDSFLERKAAEVGFLAAFTVEARSISTGDSLMQLPRFVISDSDKGPRFDRVLRSEANRLRVTDAASGHPIAGATVTAGVHVVTTDGEGYFELEPTEERVHIRAAGYRRVEGAPVQVRYELAPFLPHALYLSTFGVDDASLRDGVLKRLSKANLNALVIDVKGDRGLVGYPSAVPLAAAVGALNQVQFRDFARFVAERREKGDYLIGRIVVFKDTLLAHARPGLRVKTRTGAIWLDGEEQGWTDPFSADVREYNLALAVEAAAMGFDEIQFDYVRFPDYPNLVFSQENTEANRVAAIEAFLTEARRKLAPYNVFVSADVFGYVCWNQNDTGIGQSLEKLLPLVDYLSPMLYPSAFQQGIPGYRDPVRHPYEIVRQSLENAFERTGVDRRRFRPWLQAFPDYAYDHRNFGAGEIREQIRAAEQFGAGGWMLWNPTNVYPPF